MSDMTRENAIKILEFEKQGVFKSLATKEALAMAISALSENKGEWIDKGNGSYVCSNCKTEWTTSQIEKMCFCPTCGADMREPKGEKGT